MARREYRIVKMGEKYYPQRREGWRTLWRWRALRGSAFFFKDSWIDATFDRFYGHVECSSESRAARVIREYEQQRRAPRTPTLVVAHMAPVETVQWQTVSVEDGARGDKAAEGAEE